MGEEEGDGETHAAEEAHADDVAPGGSLGQVGQAESHGQHDADGDAQGFAQGPCREDRGDHRGCS